MLIKFEPNYTITVKTAQNLLKIETVKQSIQHLPLTPHILRSLRETARLYTTHYSTMIEGNKLDPLQIEAVIKENSHFPGRERDEHEVKSYYTALEQVELWAHNATKITEEMVQTLHALVMGNGSTKVTPTKYRDGQNVIRDGITKSIIYMPPEAKDVANLCQSMVQWLNEQTETPYPIVAAIIHYQFATIHPYYDGNGRTARLLTTLILHRHGYDLKGLYSLEEYYAQNLGGYYDAITIGSSHNYYMGRAEADITKWIDYFIQGMTQSFENVYKRMQQEQPMSDQSELLRTLDPRQRKTVELFIDSTMITTSQIAKLFGFAPRTAAKLSAQWVKIGFLKIANPSNKARKYKLADMYEKIINSKN
ncbi:Fic family protein [Candidatus Chromulinivorax destructor]|uniref:Cell filamentation protein Fic n=1 Tax=Candidatus Chromulinivorax destructor TaxID=2066483 RepID=A0A345ZCV0_9BACT|nr:Fic family protein [Candidatus Chromulinivorax destructor]AXK61117.1 cell filamentation protein Fic [Candidatus Chromulinivorax destructor]